MLSGTDSWVESLSPWPREFGLGRMRRLLAALGDPQLRFPAIHVVGTNGKGTTARTIEETLNGEGLTVGGYYSPHVTGWPERIRIAGAEADFEAVVARVRDACERLGATQFEVLTAAALRAFADAAVDVAVIEAGLGGRLDATNVLRSPVQVLTNVALEHTDVLGDTREAIAAEKLAVIQPGSAVVLGEPEWGQLARRNRAGRVLVETGGNRALAGVAVHAFLGRAVTPARVALPGRLERRGREIWDGAHTPEAVAYIAPRLPPIQSVVASVLEDKDVARMLFLLAQHADRFVATRSSHPRALPADELAARALPLFDHVEPVEDPKRALERARELAGEDGTVLVTGSLYLLADLHAGKKTYHAPVP